MPTTASSRRIPENQGRVTYLQIAPLSRADVRAYAQIRSTLEQAAGRTTASIADTDWTPIRYLNRNFPHAVVMGFFRASQVGLVTPLRDGMNLVAKEFVAAQDPDDPGVLVLSTLAGAAQRTAAARCWSIRKTRAAWRAPSSRRCRCGCPSGASGTSRCSKSCAATTSTAWHTRFVDGLQAAHQGSTERAIPHPQRDQEQEHAERRRELPAIERVRETRADGSHRPRDRCDQRQSRQAHEADR